MVLIFSLTKSARIRWALSFLTGGSTLSEKLKLFQVVLSFYNNQSLYNLIVNFVTGYACVDCTKKCRLNHVVLIRKWAGIDELDEPL